jgi:hypothetical protein
MVLLAPLGANPLEDLRSTLKHLNGTEVLKASVEHQAWASHGDEKHPKVSQGAVNAWVEEGNQGLKIFWGPEILRKATLEARARLADPEKPEPTRKAMGSLDALKLQGYFNASNELLQDLETATLLEDQMGIFDGKPARRLLFHLVPRLDKEEQEMVKGMDATAKVWLDKDGVPLGAEEEMHMKFRAYVVVSFTHDQTDTFHYEVRGGRLVTRRHDLETQGAGMGHHDHVRDSTILRYN